MDSGVSKIGVMAVNLGTPEAPTAKALRPYLRQFLSDPRVIDINAAGRFLLVNAIIVPFRSPKSAKAYQKVWTEEGSPLLMHGLHLTAKLAERAGVPTALGMRYGQPSISRAMADLVEEGCDRIVVLPLFPQYSSAAWGSGVAEVYEEAAKLPVVPSLTVVPPYFEDEDYIEALRASAASDLESFQPDHILMSYHGIPERHCRKSDFAGGEWCTSNPDCCEVLRKENRGCYRAQCLASSRALAKALGLADEAWSMSFQSRLGRDPWIGPATDDRVEELAKTGTKRLAVLCPSFVADCLETIEEIGMEARDEFLEAGGEDFHMVPCLNSDAAWADAALAMMRRAAPELGAFGAKLPAASAGLQVGSGSE